MRTSLRIEELILAPDTIVLCPLQFPHYFSLAARVLKQLPTMWASIVMLPPRLHTLKAEQRHTHMTLQRILNNIRADDAGVFIFFRVTVY